MASVSLADFQSEAEKAGFSLFGIRRPQEPIHYSVFKGWISKGLHAGMEWIARDYSLRLRKNPSLLLEDCLSVVSLAVHYPLPDALPGQSACGLLAAYACVEDYHAVLPARMKALGMKFAAMAGQPARIKAFTDSSPIMERDLAMASGLGWIGKNTCLISPRIGSFFLLGELLMDIELPCSEPFQADRCGTCRRCIEACPTGCIREDRTIDARRCISYLTIEHDGAIPAELRSLIGDRLFGCDVCQDVCPWNSESGLIPSPCFVDTQRIPSWIELANELESLEDEFSAKYAHFPLRRTGWERHLRNVILCAGNSRSIECVPGLVKTLTGRPSVLLRSHAAWALGQIHSQAARRALDQAGRNESDPAVCAEITAALEKSDPKV